MASDTGELKWDASIPGKGVVTIDTPRTKAIIGSAVGRVFKLDPLTLAPGNNRLGWCSLGATLIRGDSFTNDCRMLVVASGWWENTGQVWGDPASVGNRWGGAPILMEAIPFTLTLPVATNRLSVWPLDERGQRRAVLPVAGTSTSSVLTIDTHTATIWYELEVARR